MNPPTRVGANQDQTPRSPPKSTCKTAAQSKLVRVGASSANPMDVVDVSYIPSEDENPPKQSVRITRSKDVKAKGVSRATGNSEAGTKARRSEKASKKRKVTRGGGSRGHGTEEGNTQQVCEGGGMQEGGLSQGGDVDVGGGPKKNPEGGSGVEGIGGSRGVEEGGKGVKVRGVVGRGDSGEAASGYVGSVHGGVGQTHIGESVIVQGGEVGVIAEESTPALSPGRGTSTYSIHVRIKTISPHKIGGNGGENNAPGGEVNPSIWPLRPSILEAHNPTKLLILNVHGTLLDMSLLTEPNPNSSIRVTKKTTNHRFVFRPWMVEFL